MIIELKPLTLAEAKDYLQERDDTKVVKEYLDKFNKISSEKALEIKKKLENIGNVKLKETHLVKLVDFLPHDAEDVHKVVNDVSLSESEVTAILDAVKQ